MKEKSLWTEVVRKGKKKKEGAENKENSPSSASASILPGSGERGSGSKSSAMKSKENGKGKKGKETIKKIRPPRSAAVVISLDQAGDKGPSYAELAVACRQIKLSDHGIDALRLRLGRTGARILEVPGENSAARADTLAASLRTVLADTGARITRLVKCADLRVSGLDDTVSTEELRSALVQARACGESEVKTGKIGPGQQGAGSAWVQCPVSAANKLAAMGRVRVGWTMARVQLLSTRPLQCFKCLQMGHVQMNCTSLHDRSNNCYHCGVPGHKAADCREAPYCAVCAEAGQPAEHRCGGKACRPPAKKKAGKNVRRRPRIARRGGSTGPPGRM